MFYLFETELVTGGARTLPKSLTAELFAPLGAFPSNSFTSLTPKGAGAFLLDYRRRLTRSASFFKISNMANITRRAKSGNDWTVAELKAYNITVVSHDAQTFFGVHPLPEPQVDAEVLNVPTADAMANDANYRLLRCMDRAMNRVPAQESSVDDFSVTLLRSLGYETRGRIIHTRLDINLLVRGETRYAKAGVCIEDDTKILLLVQEDKRCEGFTNPEPQLIAKAIAVFQANNIVRTESLNQVALDTKLIAGITMVGTLPTFYKIPVTKELSTAVATGQFPTTPTVVAMHAPDLARDALRLSEGMRPLDNRRTILQCFEAFKPFVN
jgi:hypothetical protein